MPASLRESIEREIHLATTPERAFDFWLDPALLTRWMGDRAEVDPRPGGRWRLEFGNRYVAAGEFIEIDPPHRLVLSWGWEKGDPNTPTIPPGASRIEVTFERDGDGTRLRLVHAELPEREVSGHAEGWDFFLPRLEEEALDSGSLPPTAAAPSLPTDQAIPLGEPRSVADVEAGAALATAWLPVEPERVFGALASPEITRWWVRPGTFDTREWRGEVREGGEWQATGFGRGGPYGLRGEFAEIERPRRLVHSWVPVDRPAATTTVTYLLEPLAGGTWLTLRHTGFRSREVLIATAIGWETSLQALESLLRAEAPPDRGTGDARG